MISGYLINQIIISFCIINFPIFIIFCVPYMSDHIFHSLHLFLNIKILKRYPVVNIFVLSATSSLTTHTFSIAGLLYMYPMDGLVIRGVFQCSLVVAV